MARQRRLTGFYVGLAAIAMVGAGALWLARQSGQGAGPEVIEPAPTGMDAFEGHVQGSDSAPVTIIEYADFECPACRDFAILQGPDVKRRLVETGRVRWIFRDFPIEGHRNSMPAHLAAACAGEQGRFWEMHDQLFFNHRRWVTEARPERRLRELARAIAVDGDRFDECLGSARYRDRILATRQEGIERGVSSTPTFDINTLRVTGALGFDSIRVLVDRMTPPQP
jgi:protein-disulfide isomerase